MIHNLIETAIGRNHSQSSTPIPNPKPGFHVVETADNVGVWNESTLVYDPIPPPRLIPVNIFISRFTDQEKEDLVEAAKTIKKANTFIKILPMIGVADLDSDFITIAVNGMEQIGIISSGRAAVILS